MKKKFLEEEIKYTGKELQPHWAYKNFAIQGDSIVCFEGECEVKLSEMVDIEDVLENAPIYSKKMLHFIVEHFNMDLIEGVVRQRLLVSIAKEQMLKYLPMESNIERKGDDLFFAGKKLSVSIATKSITSVLIHLGINISSDDTPIDTSGLTTDMELKNISEIGNDIIKAYAKECEEIIYASTKVRGV